MLEILKNSFVLQTSCYTLFLFSDSSKYVQWFSIKIFANKMIANIFLQSTSDTLRHRKRVKYTLIHFVTKPLIRLPFFGLHKRPHKKRIQVSWEQKWKINECHRFDLYRRHLSIWNREAIINTQISIRHTGIAALELA